MITTKALREMEQSLSERFRPELDFLNTYVKGGCFTMGQIRDIEEYVGLPLNIEFQDLLVGKTFTMSHFNLTLGQ